MRRGQAAVLLAAAVAPALAVALVALACLGARARAEHAQRLADVAALRAALGLPPPVEPGAEIAVTGGRREAAAHVELRAAGLRLPLLRGVAAYAVAADAVARAVTTAEGRAGAVLVGAAGTTIRLWPRAPT